MTFVDWIWRFFGAIIFYWLGFILLGLVIDNPSIYIYIAGAIVGVAIIVIHSVLLKANK